jgi:hypothetical protein
MSRSNVYSVGLRNVGSYQVAGAPFISGNINTAVTNGIRVAFPYVTSWIKVVNNDGANRTNFGFSQRQVQDNGSAAEKYYTILGQASGSGELKVKVSEIWLSGSSTNVTVYAGLTNISDNQINNAGVSPSGTDTAGNLSYGSTNRNWSGSVGVG